MPSEQLARWAESADVVIAADSGSDRLSAWEGTPQIVIGDMDSIKAQPPQTTVIRLEEQDSTDCDKLLAHIRELGHPSVTLASVEGDRLDHVLSTVASAARTELMVRLALRRGVAWVITSGQRVEVPVFGRPRLSLMPIKDSEGVTLQGVEWPLSEASLSAIGLVSVSNRASSNKVMAKIGSGAAILVVESAGIQEPDWTVGFVNP